MKRVFLMAAMAAGVGFGAGLPGGKEILEGGFSVELDVDFSGVDGAETLYEAGPARLVFRMAGEDAALRDYDENHGNYLPFRRGDGRAPVVEATIAEKAGRVGLPLAYLPWTGGVHRVRLEFTPVKWSISAGGRTDEDFPNPDFPVKWEDGAKERVASGRVKRAEFRSPWRAAGGDGGGVRKIAGPIQYWTPEGHNAWVGDVAPAWLNGKLHVFYLFDRRHHGSGAGAGRHQFAHLATEDLREWEEYPMAVPIAESWQTVGTGTPFLKDGKLAIAFGWHTSRFKAAAGKPEGGTYAVSADGVRFGNSGVIVNDAQNPSIYNLADGRYELVTSYGGSIGIFRSRDLLNWELYDNKLPFRGDCPSLFEVNGRRYLLQGFTNMAYSEDGKPGTFVDWTGEADKLYDGLSVPMVAEWKGGRRLYIGWLNHVAKCGWGGWLVFREVVWEEDGRLGLKWVDEIAAPGELREYRMRGGERFELRFGRVGGGAGMKLAIDPAERTACFMDEVEGVKFNPTHWGQNVRIGGVRGLGEGCGVRVRTYYDAKSDATIFDAEIGRRRTIICRRRGRWLVVSC